MPKASEAARINMSDEHRAAINQVERVLAALRSLPAEDRVIRLSMIRGLLWIVTEFKPGFKHKYAGLRWRTPKAHETIVSGTAAGVRHEHVVERKWMAAFLEDHPEVVSQALWNYPACLIMKDEDALLKPHKSWGWQRYLDAGLTVMDAETGEEADLPSMNEQLRALYEKLGANP